MTSRGFPRRAVPGLAQRDGGALVELLQADLYALNDLRLTLKAASPALPGLR